MRRFLLLAVLLLPLSVLAQGKGEIQLAVTDSSGQSLTATGTVENLLTGVTHSWQTDTHGNQTLANLPYGRYRLTVQATGFAPQTVLLTVDSTAPLQQRITLAVGAWPSMWMSWEPHLYPALNWRSMKSRYRCNPPKGMMLSKAVRLTSRIFSIVA